MRNRKWRARERAISQRGYIAALIVNGDRGELDALAEEGYRLLSGDIRPVDCGACQLIRETLPPWRDTEPEDVADSHLR